jgi:hypothetical protein
MYIIFPQDVDKLAVVVPTGETTLDHIVANDIPAGTPHSVVASLDGIDAEYFDGFVYNNGSPAADMGRCKSIHLDKFRIAREPKLQALDVAYMKALEVEDHTGAASIAVQKQELRDVTLTPLPDTLPELKATWPEILN